MAPRPLPRRRRSLSLNPPLLPLRRRRRLLSPRLLLKAMPELMAKLLIKESGAAEAEVASVETEVVVEETSSVADVETTAVVVVTDMDPEKTKMASLPRLARNLSQDAATEAIVVASVATEVVAEVTEAGEAAMADHKLVTPLTTKNNSLQLTKQRRETRTNNEV